MYQPNNSVEKSGFTCTIWTDYGKGLSLFDIERNSYKGFYISIILSKIFYFNHSESSSICTGFINGYGSFNSTGFNTGRTLSANSSAFNPGLSKKTVRSGYRFIRYDRSFTGFFGMSPIPSPFKSYPLYPL